MAGCAKWARYLAVVVLLAAGCYVLLSHADHGISNDEEVQHVYGRLLFDFYLSGLTDLRAFAYKNLYLYGGLFDLIAASLERLFGFDPDGEAVWTMRHLLSGIFGLAGLAGCWMLGRRVGGEWVGLLALILLLITGAWTGAMFTHTKDIPFAAAMVWVLYFTLGVLRGMPTPGLGERIGLGVALGCAFGLRVGAVFGVFYLGVGILVTAWLRAEGNWRLSAGMVVRSALALWPSVVLAFVLMGVFWPWAVRSPENLWTAMTTFSHFSFELHTVLDGKVMANGEVPPYYLLAYLLVRLPEVFLLGLGCACVAGLSARWQKPDVLRRPDWLPLVLAGCFPVLYTLLAAPPLYNGMRHFTFILPPLAVLAAAGLVAGWRAMSKFNGGRRVAALSLTVLVSLSLVGLARLHPYEHLAYNALIGGVEGTPGKWEQDYWADSLREARSMLEARHKHEPEPVHPYKVAVCAESLQVAVGLDPRFVVTRDWHEADFFLAATHMACDEVLEGEVIGRVERAGVTLAVVKDRRNLVGEARKPR